MLKIALIIGSTRPQRFADRPAAWIVEGAKAYSSFALETLDLRELRSAVLHGADVARLYGRRLFEPREPRSGARRSASSTASSSPLPEYNHGPTAVLKNAFDQAFGVAPQAHRTSSAMAASVAPARSSSCAERRSNCRWRRSSTKVNISMEPFLGDRCRASHC